MNARVMAGVGAGFLFAPLASHAQASAQRYRVTGAIHVQVDLKALDPHITAIREKCTASQMVPAGAVIAFDKPMQEAKVTGGAVKTMLDIPFTIGSATDFTYGEVWKYSCSLTLVTQTSASAKEVERAAVVGAGAKGPTHLASGRVSVEGEFTLK